MMIKYTFIFSSILANVGDAIHGDTEDSGDVDGDNNGPLRQISEIPVLDELTEVLEVVQLTAPTEGDGDFDGEVEVGVVEPADGDAEVDVGVVDLMEQIDLLDAVDPTTGEQQQPEGRRPSRVAEIAGMFENGNFPLRRPPRQISTDQNAAGVDEHGAGAFLDIRSTGPFPYPTNNGNHHLTGAEFHGRHPNLPYVFGRPGADESAAEPAPAGPAANVAIAPQPPMESLRESDSGSDDGEEPQAIVYCSPAPWSTTTSDDDDDTPDAASFLEWKSQFEVATTLSDCQEVDRTACEVYWDRTKLGLGDLLEEIPTESECATAMQAWREGRLKAFVKTGSDEKDVLSFEEVFLNFLENQNESSDGFAERNQLLFAGLKERIQKMKKENTQLPDPVPSNGDPAPPGPPVAPKDDSAADSSQSTVVLGDTPPPPATSNRSPPAAAPKKKTTGGSGCFPASALLQTTDGVVDMASLQVGTFVRDGEASYARVTGFLHRSVNATSVDYIVLKFHDNMALEVTANHRLFLSDGRDVFAGNVKVGDTLASGQVVRDIRVARRDSLFAPVTDSGLIMVNGVLASLTMLSNSKR